MHDSYLAPPATLMPPWFITGDRSDEIEDFGQDNTPSLDTLADGRSRTNENYSFTIEYACKRFWITWSQRWYWHQGTVLWFDSLDPSSMTLFASLSALRRKYPYADVENERNPQS